LALEAHKRSALREAVEVLREAARRRPNEPRLHHELGRLHLLLEDTDAAGADFARAIALAPNRGAASTLADDLLELGRLLHRKGQYSAAVRAYEGVLQVRPARTIARCFLAESLIAQRRYPEAGEALDRYLETTPLLASGGPGGGVSRQLPAGMDTGEVRKALVARGLIHAEQKNFRAAIDCYTWSLKLGRDPDTLALRGWAYLLLAAPSAALPDFEEALKLRPGSADPLLGRANVRVTQGRIKEALADAEEGSRRGSATSRTAYLAARVYSLAVAGLPDSPATSRSGLAAAYTRRAAELLRTALLREPAEVRSAFWTDQVGRDRAFDPIRRSWDFRIVEAELVPTSR
jgi:tetratricopeptide (TPR) repeat protein